MIAGIQYTLGRRDGIEQLINYAEPEEYIPSNKQALQGIRQLNAKASLNEFALFFGLIVDFINP